VDGKGWRIKVIWLEEGSQGHTHDSFGASHPGNGEWTPAIQLAVARYH